jgi:homoserine dehydrogenase
MPPVRVGLLGIGVVGSGTFKVLKRNQEDIVGRAGRGIEIVMVAARDVVRARAIVGAGIDVVDDPWRVVNDPSIDVVVEVIGGCTLAKDLVLQAIANGKHVVIANKALLATHGMDIFAAARARAVVVAFEGAVAVSIPIIKALREGLSGNRIEWVAGIINGTTNFILSEMRDKGVTFDAALREAQRLGYAEADPTFDVDGIDAAHKATLLASIAFGIPVQFDKAHVEGIARLDAVDIASAERLGYRVKLLGIARRTAAGIELRVHPALVPARCLIANVEGSMNAIMVKSDAAGVTMYYGAGAGSEQTASAVIADLIDITRLATADHEHRVPYLAFQPHAMVQTPVLPIAAVRTAYYLRIAVLDEPGVMADITRLLAQHDISIDALQQPAPAGRRQTDVIVLTHETVERSLDAALAGIAALPTVVGTITKLRVETLA